MAVSGAVLDTQFATGFLSAFSKNASVVAGGDDHYRPKADLGSPLGKITGDLGCAYDTSTRGRSRLLIVEREGSAPGNERNILKWVRALKSGQEIRLETRGRAKPVRSDAVTVLLAFGRSSKWDESDFQKTVGFCQFLAEIIGVDLPGADLHVWVEAYPTVVGNWEQCGQHFGERAAELAGLIH